MGLTKLVNNEKLHLCCGEQCQSWGFTKRDFPFGSDEDFKFIAYDELHLWLLGIKPLVLSISVKRFLEPLLLEILEVLTIRKSYLR